MTEEVDIGRKRSNKWYGCRRDTRDKRDIAFKPKAIRVKRAVDLRCFSPPIMNQGPLGACTGHGTVRAIRLLMRASGLPDIELSRLQNYFDARELEDSINDDAGAEIRDNIKSAVDRGICRETLWPYDIARFKERPSAEAYQNALSFQALEYNRVEINASHIKMALTMGFPVIIGISLYDSFESDEVATNGVVPMPNLDTEGLVGGHCMVVEGYEHGYGIVANSWDTDWGDKGYAYIPLKYLGDPGFGADYWVITKAELTDQTGEGG